MEKISNRSNNFPVMFIVSDKDELVTCIYP